MAHCSVFHLLGRTGWSNKCTNTIYPKTRGVTVKGKSELQQNTFYSHLNIAEYCHILNLKPTFVSQLVILQALLALFNTGSIRISTYFHMLKSNYRMFSCATLTIIIYSCTALP